MKLPCKVIEDMLPMYYDKVCSQESAALVEEHLRSLLFSSFHRNFPESGTGHRRTEHRRDCCGLQ